MTFLKDVANVWYFGNFNFDSNINKVLMCTEIYSVKQHRSFYLFLYFKTLL